MGEAGRGLRVFRTRLGLIAPPVHSPWQHGADDGIDIGRTLQYTNSCTTQLRSHK
jgi:hypothetical protein